MAFHITTRFYNGYRCGCCTSDSEDGFWKDTIEEAMEGLPREFPRENEHGGEICYEIKDGSTGKVIAESKVTFAPKYQRGDGYQYTRWDLFIDEEACPGQGCSITQIISGIASEGTELVFLERTWSELCDGLSEKRRQQDLNKAQKDLEDAQRRLAALQTSK